MSSSTSYQPGDIESKWYPYWEEGGFFRASDHSDKEPHVIMMPPPNVTGRLHMGHALQSTVQDALTRLRRMQGYEALWMPGIDHAGIATQNVVEKQLKQTEKRNRHDLGRDAFIERVWDWKEEYGGIIVEQMRKLGVSADWERQRFTMDDGFSRAVQHVFVQLYQEGLIYRGNYLVNWCPIDQTALSDEEVDNVERDGHLWHIRYPFADGNGHMTVATTRPETMLGDAAVAVHPDDERYAAHIGKKVILPLVGREIPVIGDEYVKMEFGAGALKITPGHDKNDFEIGQRHGLAVVSVIRPDGKMDDEAGGKYAGTDRFEAREQVVEDLQAAGLLEKVEPYKVMVPISSRSKAIIEPLISRQWFVKMKPLAEPAIEAVRDGTITFHPKRWENEYFRWMDNIRDWTISRQLWWGHRIPVWYHTQADGEIDESREFVVSVDRPASDTDGYMKQDEDVLDTWFSSWLWPFGTLGWPDETPALKKFYPGSVLVSGYDILFFWIARMIMAGMHFAGAVPYRDIFITGMVKDKQGRWMSKSLGNGIDPLDMIEQYGADAVRFSLTVLCAQGQDIKLDPLKFEMGRNFANKIWNAYNVFGQFIDDPADHDSVVRGNELTLVERWMLHRLNATIAALDEQIERYRLNEALLSIYDLFWRDFCDWYLELIKPRQGETMPAESITLSLEIYEKLLLLLHPFMPFITEELWQRMRSRPEGASIMVQPWPTADSVDLDAEAAELFGTIQDMISGIRNVRAQYQVKPGQDISASVLLAPGSDHLVDSLRAAAPYFEKLARVSELTVGLDTEKPPASAAVVVGEHQVFVPLAGLIDLDVERDRLEKEIDNKERQVVSLDRKLNNDQFVSRAPEDVVAREREKRQAASAELAKLRANLVDLEASV